MPRPDWSRPLPRPLSIPDVLTLETLADVRVLVEKHLPAEYRSKFTWRQLAGLVKRAAEGKQDVAEVSTAPADRAAARGRQMSVGSRRFPAPWDIEEYDRSCFIVRDNNGQALAYVYFETEPGSAQPPTCSRATRQGGLRRILRS